MQEKNPQVVELIGEEILRDIINKMKLKKYIWNNLLAVDRCLNALSGGDSRETISSRVGKNPHCSWVATGMYYILNWLDPNHCEDAKEIEHKEIGSDNVF